MCHAAGDFVNFETPTVHPLDLSPSGNLLAAVNTADNRLLLFDVADGNPRQVAAIAVGLDPVSVRFRSESEAWVVNQISDSVSIVDLPTRRVRATLDTDDEPADVVFAGGRAFVSCSQADTVLVFDAGNPARRPRRVEIEAEDPRAMAVSGDGGTVFVGIFESGNRSTVLAGGFAIAEEDARPTIPRNVVSDPDGPYGGQNPPPNRGDGFFPPIAADLPVPPPVSLIVKKIDGRWRDDNGADWTAFVSGSEARRTRRVRGWDVLDRDVAVIDARSLEVSWVEGLMNLVMALAVNPADGRVTAVGTDATNEVRFEPVLNGVFLRVLLGRAAVEGDRAVTDLNPHLAYDAPRVAKSQRKLSLGDPRAIVWRSDGERGWVAGMGSNNVVAIDREGGRVGDPIQVGKGPVGLALDERLGRLYVLERFSASITVVDTRTGGRAARVSFFDPTPKAIRRGRPFLYDTQLTSGTGHVACASCHADARTDRLGWDLGAPDGSMKGNEDQNRSLIPGDTFADWHPMKGPMTTQTLQDIIGKEPHHWRGDRDGLEEFAEAFHGLLGDDKALAGGQMRRFERFLATIHFPPNPFRRLDNRLPARLELDGHYRSGRFGREGEPMPAGDPRRGLELFVTKGFEGEIGGIGIITCAFCHALPTGQGTPARRDGLSFVSIPRGRKGETHQALIGEDASEQLGFKIPHLRNAYDKVGMEYGRKRSRAGFGFFHDGTVDSLTRFVSAEVFAVESDQEVADLVALLLAFSGSDLGTGAPAGGLLPQPPGTDSRDAHAAVGRQATLAGSGGEGRELVEQLIALAATGAVDLVVKGRVDGSERGWLYERRDDAFRPDQASAPALPLDALLELAAPGSELTFTAVPTGSGERIGLDKDRDKLLDYDEVRDLDPETPGVQNPFDPSSRDVSGDRGKTRPDRKGDGRNDFDGDGVSNARELAAGTDPLRSG